MIVYSIWSEDGGDTIRVDDHSDGGGMGRHVSKYELSRLRASAPGIADGRCVRRRLCSSRFVLYRHHECRALHFYYHTPNTIRMNAPLAVRVPFVTCDGSKSTIIVTVR